LYQLAITDWLDGLHEVMRKRRRQEMRREKRWCLGMWITHVSRMSRSLRLSSTFWTLCRWFTVNSDKLGLLMHSCNMRYLSNNTSGSSDTFYLHNLQ